MMTLDILGWAGNIFILLGLLLVSYQRRSGFIHGFIGNTLWGIKGYLTYQYDLLTIEIIIVIIQIFAWHNWGRINVESVNSVHSRTDSE